MITTFLFCNGCPDTDACECTLERYDIPDEILANHRAICLVRDGKEHWFTEDDIFDGDGYIRWFEHWNPPIKLNVGEPLSREANHD